MSGFILPDDGPTTIVLQESAGMSVVISDDNSPLVVGEFPSETIVVTMAIPGPPGRDGDGALEWASTNW